MMLDLGPRLPTTPKGALVELNNLAQAETIKALVPPGATGRAAENLKQAEAVLATYPSPSRERLQQIALGKDLSPEP